MRYTLTLFLSVFGLLAMAQENVEMADTMRADGKIYVVVLVLSIILAGMFIYLWTIDRKLTRMENNKKEE